MSVFSNERLQFIQLPFYLFLHFAFVLNQTLNHVSLLQVIKWLAVFISSFAYSTTFLSTIIIISLTHLCGPSFLAAVSILSLLGCEHNIML